MPAARLLRVLLSATLLALPLPAAAQYLTPEEVLFSEAFFLPPSQGSEAQERVSLQQERSRLRREREQQLIFGSHQPPEPPVAAAEPDATHGSASAEDSGLRLILTPEDRELLRVLARLRGEDDELHGGAPYTDARQRDLAGTGAGAILTVLAMAGAVVWTMRRARRKVSSL